MTSSLTPSTTVAQGSYNCRCLGNSLVSGNISVNQIVWVSCHWYDRTISWFTTQKRTCIIKLDKVATGMHCNLNPAWRQASKPLRPARSMFLTITVLYKSTYLLTDLLTFSDTVANISECTLHCTAVTWLHLRPINGTVRSTREL